MKLSLRLKSIANLVDSNDVVADIGCDHAYLDIYLDQQLSLYAYLYKGNFSVSYDNIYPLYVKSDDWAALYPQHGAERAGW